MMTALQYQEIIRLCERIEERCLYGQHAYEPTSVFADIVRDTRAIREAVRDGEVDNE